MKKRSFIIAGLIIFVLISCTIKKNPVGFQGGIQPVSITFDYSIFNNSYSFEDSVDNYQLNTNFLVGEYNSNNSSKELRSLLRFNDLPDSISSIDGDVTIELQIRNRFNYDIIDNTTISVGKLTSDWADSETTWLNATDTLSWSTAGGDFEIIENDTLQISCVEDTLQIKLPISIITDWINADSLNFGLILIPQITNAFLEIYSKEYTTDSESEFNPSLSFNYFISESDTVATEFNNELTNDTFIYSFDEQLTIFENYLTLSNIKPIKMYLDFDLSDSLFINSYNSGIYNADDYRRMTVNRAELILSVIDDDPIYPITESIYIKPYYVTSDTLNFDDIYQPMLTADDYLFAGDVNSSDSLQADQIKIDITNVIQFFTSGEIDNKGILLKSIYENKDLRHLSFATRDHYDETKRPKLNIIYTPPYLDE